MAYHFCKDCKGKFMALSETEGSQFEKLGVLQKENIPKVSVRFCPYCGGKNLEGGDSARHRKKKS